jgi:SAM-dependent methyltransferase
VRPDRATEQSTADRAVAAGSPERFGFEWQNYSELRQEYEDQFRRWTAPIDVSEWHDLRFLDVGCGMGRNSYWPMTYGARSGVAIDVNEGSLASARQTLSPFPTMTVRHLSAYDIDYRDEFDIAFSIGVIHHLENPQRALEAMVRAVKPGGRVLIWVYGLENNEWIVRLVSPLRRLIFSRLPIGLLHWFSWFPAAGLWLALHLGFGRTEYARQTRGFTFRHLRSIVFDQLLPRIAHYWPKSTVAAMMSDAGLSDVELIAVNEISWAAVGTKSMNADGLEGNEQPENRAGS